MAETLLVRFVVDLVRQFEPKTSLREGIPTIAYRVCNPGLPEPENPGNPDFFQTRNPGLNRLPNPGFRVWIFSFLLVLFFQCNVLKIICVTFF
jgi:hypothetical protein